MEVSGWRWLGSIAGRTGSWWEGLYIDRTTCGIGGCPPPGGKWYRQIKANGQRAEAGRPFFSRDRGFCTPQLLLIAKKRPKTREAIEGGGGGKKTS
jgi:hypothetical protein